MHKIVETHADRSIHASCLSRCSFHVFNCLHIHGIMSTLWPTLNLKKSRNKHAFARSRGLSNLRINQKPCYAQEQKKITDKRELKRVKELPPSCWKKKLIYTCQKNHKLKNFFLFLKNKKFSFIECINIWLDTIVYNVLPYLSTFFFRLAFLVFFYFYFLFIIFSATLLGHSQLIWNEISMKKISVAISALNFKNM